MLPRTRKQCSPSMKTHSFLPNKSFVFTSTPPRIHMLDLTMRHSRLSQFMPSVLSSETDWPKSAPILTRELTLFRCSIHSCSVRNQEKPMIVHEFRTIWGFYAIMFGEPQNRPVLVNQHPLALRFHFLDMQERRKHNVRNGISRLVDRESCWCRGSS